jgi:hypothetical protein
VGDLLRRLDATRRNLEGAAATHEPVPEGIPARADIDRTIDGLFANQRARRPLQDARPDAATVAGLLDEVEAILVDRLGGEG